ncbi:sporulation protein YunB [Sporosarcina sp. P37]|uniref:sporulation protein YunB n=1 Tax=unclassified Sporosarcina TaxID=2647733 RepID=UPI0009BD8A68|nr:MULTISPECIES: sporulation protein YunB [unclassified Sporosarcina]ARD47450.1 sporulation protein YunB [Sporosarcina sp. P33]ARK24020.1 sporulation protein YunB [Sporosarcina sp. P37]PID18591.1 sporulation protein YunB [Sporosarcina sp. P35]
MRFYTNQKRPKRHHYGKNILRFVIPSIFVAVAMFFYTVNKQLTPIYTQYAEVQTQKIASHVISQAIQNRTTSVYDVNEIIENVPDDTKDTVTTKFNAEIISQVMSEIHQLVEDHLERAEGGDLDMLPPLGDLEYNPDRMEKEQGIVFFVPLGQATNIPLIGNLGPKIPIRFHVVGDVHATVDTNIREFGINNAYVEVNLKLQVNVQIIVPLATSKSVVEQEIPIAMGLIRGKVPQIYSKGEQTPAQIEVPLEDTE